MAIDALANLAVICRGGIWNSNGHDALALSSRQARSDEDGTDGGGGGDGGSDSGSGSSGSDGSGDESGDGGGDDGSGDGRTRTLSPDAANDFVVTTTFPGNLSTTYVIQG